MKKQRLTAKGVDAPATATVSTGGSSSAVVLRLVSPRLAAVLLIAAVLLPNIGALTCGFVFDDLPMIVENQKLHSLSTLPQAWKSGIWPDGRSIPALRPVSQAVWATLWIAGGGSPVPFHAANLLLAVGATLLAWSLLREVAAPNVAFLAALVWALFPIHTEAVTSIIGSAELLAAVFGFAAVLLHRHGRPGPALLLFALAVFSKESGATFAGVAGVLWWLTPPRPVSRKILARDAIAAGAVVLAALIAHRLAAKGPALIPPMDNPMSLLPWGGRILTALWVQVLYLGKTFFPIEFAADYSYKQIPLVMSFDNLRAFAGCLLVIAAGVAFWRWRSARLPVALWVIPFTPTANVLFPIGTIMGERLAYVPSLGAAVALALLLVRLPRCKLVLVCSLLILVCGAGTAVRNMDWRNADAFYPALVKASPASTKAWYFLGVWHSARGRDTEALAAYDRAIEIFPAYPEALNNRGNTLVSLGRIEEAKDSYRRCLRFDPTHKGAAASLSALEAGSLFTPQRRRL